MRLFVGVWPPPEVRHLLAGLERPELDGIRWTAPDQWHVTLAFLGEVPERETESLAAALAGAAACVAAPPEAILGPTVTLLSRTVLCVPVAGLDGAAAAVRASVPGADAADALPFRGHLTLARARGRRRMPPGLAGSPVEARWTAAELCLIGSVPGAAGSVYTTVASATVPS